MLGPRARSGTALAAGTARLVPILMAIVALALTAAHVPAAEPPRSGNPVFDRTVELVIGNFFDPSALDAFTEAVRHEVQDPLAPVTAASPAARVDAAIDTILASLKASHTRRYRPDTIDYFELVDIFRHSIRGDIRRLFPPEGDVGYAGIGMIAVSADGQLFVSEVYDGSPAARAGILVGDELLAVDGKPYDEIASFRDKVNRTVEVLVRRRPCAAPLTIKVKVERLEPLRTFERAITGSIELTERDGYRIGYVRLWTLAARRSMDIVAEALATSPLKRADGLVLDLRGRWGGGRADAAELLVGDTPEFRLIPRKGEEIHANVRWQRPVVAIIDAGSRSGLEVFAYALKANGIPLVGARTAGALLAGRAYLLPDDSLLVLAVADAVIGDGERLEGKGVDPDIPVPFLLPHAAGNDPQREAAIEEMRRVLARDR